MEKLTVEIELSREELAALNAFIRHGCVDLNAYIKRLVMKAAGRHERLAECAEAGRLRRTA